MNELMDELHNTTTNLDTYVNFLACEDKTINNKFTKRTLIKVMELVDQAYRELKKVEVE